MSSPSLAERIALELPVDGVLVWWLGQAGLAVRSRDALILIDPFLTDFGSFGRLFPPPLAPEELRAVDAILVTHDHADHLDPEGLPRLVTASPDAVVVVPAPVGDRAAALLGDAATTLPASVDAPLKLAAATVLPIPAAHAAAPADGYGFHRSADGEHPFLGYAVDIAGVRLCHTGDTLVYAGLVERLRRLDLDALFLPINGVSWFREQRGLAGNMNVFEAAELSESSGAKLTVPLHWDLFADNTEDPQHFRRYVTRRHPAVKAVVPAIGTPIAIAPR